MNENYDLLRLTQENDRLREDAKQVAALLAEEGFDACLSNNPSGSIPGNLRNLISDRAALQKELSGAQAICGKSMASLHQAVDAEGHSIVGGWARHDDIPELTSNVVAERNRFFAKRKELQAKIDNGNDYIAKILSDNGLSEIHYDQRDKLKFACEQYKQSRDILEKWKGRQYIGNMVSKNVGELLEDWQKVNRDNDKLIKENLALAAEAEKLR